MNNLTGNFQFYRNRCCIRVLKCQLSNLIKHIKKRKKLSNQFNDLNCLITNVLINLTYYQNSDWSRAYNQYRVRCLSLITVIKSIGKNVHHQNECLQHNLKAPQQFFNYSSMNNVK